MDGNLLKLLELVEQDKILFQLLRQCPYEILRNFQVREYKDSLFVLNQGEIYNTFYIVASGYVDIYVESEHGKKYLLCTYGKGDYIGELELFQQAGYISRVEARGDVTMLELDRTYFVKWIRMDNNFNEYMIRTLCSNSYRMCMEMGQNTLYTLKQRICQYLVGNAGIDGKLRFVVSSGGSASHPWGGAGRRRVQSICGGDISGGAGHAAFDVHDRRRPQYGA